MLVVQNGTAHDGKRGVTADKIVGKEIDKVEQLAHRSAVAAHGCVLFGDGDAVLVVIGIGRVLQEPLFAAQLHLDRADILAGRMRARTFKALIFFTQGAHGILARLRRAQKFGDILVVLFRFGKVYSDLQHVGAVVITPLKVAQDRRLLYVPVFDGDIVQVVACRLRRPRAKSDKLFVDLGRKGRQHPEDARTVALRVRLVRQAVLHRIGGDLRVQLVRHVHCRHVRNIRLALAGRLQFQLCQQRVAHVDRIHGLQIQIPFCVGEQLFHQQFCVHFFNSDTYSRGRAPTYLLYRIMAQSSSVNKKSRPHTATLARFAPYGQNVHPQAAALCGQKNTVHGEHRTRLLVGTVGLEPTTSRM